VITPQSYTRMLSSANDPAATYGESGNIVRVAEMPGVHVHGRRRTLRLCRHTKVEHQALGVTLS
jgi:hypothetical protein